MTNEPITSTTGTANSGNIVYGGGCDSKGNLVQTETSSVGGVLTEITRVTKDNGAVDTYIDKTWD